MYLVGAAHPQKVDSQELLERLIAAGERLVADAEVLQEVLHRYTAINTRDAIEPAFRVLLDVVDDVFSVEKRESFVLERLRRVLPCFLLGTPSTLPSWNAAGFPPS